MRILKIAAIAAACCVLVVSCSGRKKVDNKTQLVNVSVERQVMPKTESGIRRMAENIPVSENDEEGYVERADVFERAGMDEESRINKKHAVEIITRILEGSKEKNRLLFRRAHLQEAIGEFDAAIADYERCKEDNTLAEEDILRFRAACYEKAGQPSKAIADFDKVILLRKDPSFFLCRGKCKLELSSHIKR